MIRFGIIGMGIRGKLFANTIIQNPYAEITAICDVSESSRVRCLMAFENRWSLPFLSVKDRIASGACGEVLHISAKLNNTLFVPTQMLPWAAKSTPAWFLFPHLVDMACWLSGKTVNKVYASGVKKKLTAMGIETYDSISALMDFSDGGTAQFSSTWVLPKSMPVVADQKFDIFCEREAISVDLMPQMVSVASESYIMPRVLGTPINGRLNGPPSHMLNSFIDNIRNDTAPVADEEAGRINTRIIDAVHQSLRIGAPVEL